jgi:hypothetical protein
LITPNFVSLALSQIIDCHQQTAFLIGPDEATSPHATKKWVTHMSHIITCEDFADAEVSDLIYSLKLS